jgi:hypothetical protein
MSRVRALVAAFSVAVVGVVLVPAAGVAADVPAARSALADTRTPRAAAATGSVLGYQCGEGVCLLDPDVPGAQPVVVVPDGRFAGVTADGRTVAWVQPGGELVTAPTAGGAPTTVYTGAVGFQPAISPDGTSFLWQFAVPINGFYYTYRLDVATQEVYGISACSCTVTHGWAGPTSIGVFPTDNGRPSRICRLDRSGDSSCVAVLVSETRGQLAFPDGSADGQTYVASIDVGGSEFGGVDGPIALFSAATGTVVKDLTSNPNDATPTLSQEGDRVAFERDDQIVIVDVATGAERVVGPGVYPSWGGARSQQGRHQRRGVGAGQVGEGQGRKDQGEGRLRWTGRVRWQGHPGRGQGRAGEEELRGQRRQDRQRQAEAHEGRQAAVCPQRQGQAHADAQGQRRHGQEEGDCPLLNQVGSGLLYFERLFYCCAMPRQPPFHVWVDLTGIWSVPVPGVLLAWAPYGPPRLGGLGGSRGVVLDGHRRRSVDVAVVGLGGACPTSGRPEVTWTTAAEPDVDRRYVETEVSWSVQAAPGPSGLVGSSRSTSHHFLDP